MFFNCERPYAFYGLIVLVPAVLIAVRKYRRIIKQTAKITGVYSYIPGGKRMKNLPRIIVLRTIFLCLAWIMLTSAYAGFSWGAYEVPSQKNGNAVSFVFDISYSMNADDAPGGLTRLHAAAKYSDILLSHMENTSVSVVLAKGDGVIVIPLTEDTAVVQSLLGTLSPDLMTAAGSSLGKGIEAALRSFPSTSAQNRHVWVFTDGDETDGQLTGALEDCVKYGVNVSLIGFGSEREIEVTAGDGRTKVMTALRSEKMKKTAAQVTRMGFSTNTDGTVRYVDATEAGSALELLRSLKAGNTDDEKNTSTVVSYEVKPVERYSLFLIMAVVFFVLSFAVAEFDPENPVKHPAGSGFIIFMCTILFLFTSCSHGKTKNAQEIMRSSWAWHQKNYRSATAGFLRTEENALQYNDNVTIQYARYDLAATYIMEGEYAAASGCLNQISPEAPPPIRYAAYYNAGIIAYRNGKYKEAADCFRDALRIDGTKIEAKENFEIARQQQTEEDVHGTKNTVTPVSQEDNRTTTIESAVFQRIRENDKKQWKNSGSEQNSESGSDY
ncbi:MAG: VWA domain-containing protein [Treponema sp.]|nr:VWA domain-containing protein [Treponema sp.]